MLFRLVQIDISNYSKVLTYNRTLMVGLVAKTVESFRDIWRDVHYKGGCGRWEEIKDRWRLDGKQ